MLDRERANFGYRGMKKETLERLIREYQGGDLAGYIAAVIEEERLLTKRMRSLQQELRDEDTRHEAEKKRLNQYKLNIQAECPHHEQTWHGDPSGGSDSYYDCDLCDKTSKKML